LHALRKSRLKAGETVAVFGAGGLGMSALQLARALGAGDVFAVDILESKLVAASRLGAIPVNAALADPVDEIRKATSGRGVDVALELIGRPEAMEQALRSLAVFGRLAIAGITGKSFKVAPYEELIGREVEIIGVSDHLAREIPLLLDLVRRGKLRLESVVTQTVALEADSINAVLDSLGRFEQQIRVVIRP